MNSFLLLLKKIRKMKLKGGEKKENMSKQQS